MIRRRALLAASAPLLMRPAIVRAQSILPGRYPSFWTPERTPIGPIGINWSHPLAKNLLCCYVPGNPHTGLSDVAGFGPTLVANSAAAVVQGQGGPGLSSNTTYGQGGAVSAGQPVNITNLLSSSTGCTLGYCGYPLSNTGGGPAPIFGITIAATRKCCLLVSAGTPCAAEWNYFNGVTSVGLNTTAPVSNQLTNAPQQPIVAWAASFGPSGQGVNWVVNNNTGLHSGTATSSFNPSWAAGDRLSIGYGLSDSNAIAGTHCLGAIWAGGLMPMGLLEQFVTAPFSFLQPEEDAMRFAQRSAGRSLGLIGVGQ